MSEERYSRQLRLAELGPEAQARLRAARVLVLGCGALGSHLASLLARAGVGSLRLVDRDRVELSNLHRQTLFDEADVEEALPKAEAAARHLRRIDATLNLEPLVLDATPRTIEPLLDGVTLALDGSDNLETRYLLNDACLRRGVPWVYGGVVGSSGMVLAIRPGEGPCLRCLFPRPPPPGSLPTCESHGVLPTAPALVAALQATQALRILVGAAICPDLLYLDPWRDQLDRIAVSRDAECPACVLGRLEYLEARATSWVSVLCGRHAVQITPPAGTHLDLGALAARLAGVGRARFNGHLLILEVEGHELVVFPDGRTIVQGTHEEAEARGLYARYLGG